MRGRPADTALAALTTLAALLPLTSLVQSQAWLRAAAGLVAVVAVVGFGLRALGARAALVVLGQVLAVGAAVSWGYAAATTWYGVPTTATALRLAELVRDFAATAYAAAAPLPPKPGVELVFPLLAAVVALLVDAVAVTGQAPAAAGLPLLAVFLTAAANSGSGLALWNFVVVAAAWLALLTQHGSRSMRRWSTPARSPVPAPDRHERLALGAPARRLGVTALLVALVVPALLPHLPTRFLLDGLARGTVGAAKGKVGYSSTLDVSRSLQAEDTTEVLSYTTTAPTAAPLRVLATATYDGSSWSRPSPVLGRGSRLEVSSTVERVERVVSVEDNTLDAPALATPQPVVAADFRGAAWSVDEATSDVYVQSRPRAYSTTYVEPVLTTALLRDGVDGRPGADPLPTSRQLNVALRVDARSDTRVRAAAAEAAGTASNPYDVAMAIQSWLRSDNRFTYSLTLPPAPTPEPLDPLSQFLETRTGYCVQFATAMVMMSRAKGIPARMAIGFLPGSRDSSGRHTVSSTDAHAWPELFFPGAGWVRFEPTPSVRTGTAPQWTLPTPAVAPSDPAQPGAEGSPTPLARDLDRGLDALDDQGVSPEERPFTERVLRWLGEPASLVLLAVPLGLLAALVLPVTAFLLRRRRQRGARDVRRVEAQWAGLTARLDDLGIVAPSGGTLREAERHYRHAAGLDEGSQQALHTVVATVERARYARPGTAAAADLAPEVRTVARAAARSRAPRQRLRAALAPREGRRWWSQVGRRAAQAARSAQQQASEQVRRLRR